MTAFPNFPATTFNDCRARHRMNQFAMMTADEFRGEWLTNEVAGWDRDALQRSIEMSKRLHEDIIIPCPVGKVTITRVKTDPNYPKMILNSRLKVFLIDNPDIAFELKDEPAHDIVLLNDDDKMLFKLGWS
jgi:hypothetical protein